MIDEMMEGEIGVEWILEPINPAELIFKKPCNICCNGLCCDALCWDDNSGT